MQKEAHKFYGGPLHREIRVIPEWQTEFHYRISEFEPIFLFDKDPPGSVTVKTAIYKMEYDTTIIWPKPWSLERRYCFVFTGFQ